MKQISGRNTPINYLCIKVFRENDPEPEIFNRKEFIFFSSKVFSRPYRHIERKKNRKKNSFQKSGRDPMDLPICIKRGKNGFVRISSVHPKSISQEYYYSILIRCTIVILFFRKFNRRSRGTVSASAAS